MYWNITLKTFRFFSISCIEIWNLFYFYTFLIPFRWPPAMIPVCELNTDKSFINLTKWISVNLWSIKHFQRMAFRGHIFFYTSKGPKRIIIGSLWCLSVCLSQSIFFETTRGQKFWSITFSAWRCYHQRNASHWKQ